MFVAHLVATIILSPKHFYFFISDKPSPRYHVAHPSTFNLWCCIQLRFSLIKILKIKYKNFFLTFFHFIYQT